MKLIRKDGFKYLIVLYILWKIDYHEEFIATGGDKHYGLVNRPLYHEGSGCSAFGASFLEVAGLLEDEFIRNFSRLRLVMTKHIGGPGTGRKVSVFKLLSKKSKYDNNRWADPDVDDYRPIFFWDPDLMFRWAEATFDREVEYPTGQWELVRIGKAKGLIADRRHIPTPTGPIFKD